MKSNSVKNYEKSLNKKTKIGVRRVFAYFNVFNTLAAMLLFCFIAFIIHLITGATFNINYFLLFVPLMSVITGLIMRFTFLKIFNYFGIFEQSLDKVANGDFDVEISTKNASIFTVMTENFNKMVKELKNNKSFNDDFVRNFSHEFKTPIASINGFAEVLLEDEITDEEKKKYLEIIKDESYRLAHLSEKALFLSRLNSKEVITDKKEYYLDEQLRNAIILTQKYWEDKNITVNANLRKIKYYNNPEILNEVWINIISNAIKYTPSNGSIDIKLTKSGEKIIVVIADTGIGIEEEKIPYIFNEYYQADLSRNNNGVGLGLSIVKKIISLVDGKIEVESIVDKGTTFKIIL